LNGQPSICCPYSLHIHLPLFRLDMVTKQVACPGLCGVGSNACRVAAAERTDGSMILMNRLMSLGLAASVIAGTMAITSDNADARRGAGIAAGVAAGVIGLGILGAAAAASSGPRPYYGGGGCYPGPKECFRTRSSCWYDRYGEYVCRGGNYVCRRPMICP